MPTTTQNSLNMDALYSYASAGFNHCKSWVVAQTHQAYSKVPPLAPLARRYTSLSFQAGKAFLWSHKEWAVSGSVVGIALLVIYYVRKNLPQLPLVKMESTLDFARVSIEIPKEQHASPNVTLTFCVDTSSSMEADERIGAVKRALNNVLKNAQDVINHCKGAQISLAIIGFNSDPWIIAPKTQLTRTAQNGENKAIQSLRAQIDTFRVSGSTNILNGLERATEELQAMARANRQSSHTLILLTDGEDSSMSAKKLATIQAKLAAASAQLFAIGIGAGHSKDVLQQIVASEKKAFRGRYIDTTAGQDTIESAISKIYNQALSSFQELELTAPGLAPDSWSVIHTPGVIDKGQLKCNLGPLSEGKILQRFIQIHGDRLKAPLELSTVVFTLTFIDPKGRRGKLSLPWNPDTTIDPNLLRAAKAG